MSIRIPPKADIDLRNAFLDIEDRLRKLESTETEKISEESETPIEETDTDLEVEGDLIVANDVTIEGSVSAPHLYDGLVKVVPTAIGSEAQRTINMAASLAIVPGGLSADSVRTRMLDATGVLGPTGTDIGAAVGGGVGCYLRRAATTSVSASTNTDFTPDTSISQMGGTFWTSGTDITPPVPGIYYCVASIYYQSGTDGSRRIYITHNGSNITGRHGSSQIDTAAQCVVTCSCLLSFDGSSDYTGWRAYMTGPANIDVLDTNFQMFRVGDYDPAWAGD